MSLSSVLTSKFSKQEIFLTIQGKKVIIHVVLLGTRRQKRYLITILHGLELSTLNKMHKHAIKGVYTTENIYLFSGKTEVSLDSSVSAICNVTSASGNWSLKEARHVATLHDSCRLQSGRPDLKHYI